MINIGLDSKKIKMVMVYTTLQIKMKTKTNIHHKLDLINKYLYELTKAKLMLLMVILTKVII